MQIRAERKIMAGEFATALAAAGIIDNPGNVRRIVLDAEAGEPLRFYVEYYADRRWLDVAVTLDGIKVTTEP